jgi:hypothetical protein
MQITQCMRKVRQCVQRHVRLPLVAVAVVATIPWGWTWAQARVKVPAFELTEDALFAGRVTEAEAGFALIVADPLTAPRERAKAGVHWALIAWRVDADAKTAISRVNHMAATGADPCLLGPVLLRVLRESNQWGLLRRTLGEMPTACERAADWPDVQAQAAFSWVALAQQSAPSRRPQMVVRASKALQAVEPSVALDLELCRWVLALGLLADDPSLALDGWRRYFRSGQTAGPAALDAIGIDAKPLFERSVRPGASRSDRLHVAELLARTGFVDALRAFTQQHRLHMADDDKSRSVQAYLVLRDEIAAITSTFNRKVARQVAHDPEAYDRDLRLSFARAAERLMGKRIPVGDDGKPDVDGVLRAAWGLWMTTGNTNGVAALHAGHVVIDEAKAVSQFGQNGKIRFFVLDNMLGNGFSTWVSDGASSVGGWAIDGATIMQVREPYETGALRLVTLRVGQPGRLDAEAQVNKLAADDLLAATQDANARLLGLGLRLKLQSVDEVDAAATAALPASTTAVQREQAFLRMWAEQTTQRSIVVHGNSPTQAVIDGRSVQTLTRWRSKPKATRQV